MKIGFFGTRHDDRKILEEKLSRLGIGETFWSEEVIDGEHLPAESDLEALCIFTDSTISTKVFDHLPKLKFIAVRATGFDNVDLVEAAKRGVVVSNVPSYGEHTVAEFAWGLILNLSRKIYWSIDQIKEDGNFSPANLTGFDLFGKTLGVVGTGRIGKHVAKMAKGFEMNVVAFDVYPNEALAAELGFKYLSLDELLATSDIVTLHVPYSKETHHLIGKNELAKMKKTAYLVNTSRGGILDTMALVESLRAGQIAGAALDVLEEEGVIRDEMEFLKTGETGGHNMKTILADHVLIDMPNVLITPHNAFNSREAFERILDTSVMNIKAFADGKPINTVKNG